MLSKRQPPLGSSTALTFRAERSSTLTRKLTRTIHPCWALVSSHSEYQFRESQRAECPADSCTKVVRTPHLNCPHFDHSSRAFYVPLWHIWAGTYGHSVGHPALRCTTPSAASGVLLHHFGCGAEQVCSTAVRHHRTAQLRAPPPAGSSALPLTYSRFRPVRARPPATVCGFPFFANYATYTTSPAMSSRPRAGSPPWRHRSPSASCRVSPSALRGLLHLLGQSGGFQAATTVLLGDPKNKEFMTIVTEAIDELQLLNRRRVLKRAIRECIRRWKTDAVGATLARSSRRKGRQTLGWECLLGKCFRGIFLLYCMALVSSPPAFIVYAGSSSVFLLLSRWSVTALSVLLPVPRTQTLVGRRQSRSCRGGTFGCTMLSSSEFHGEASQKGSLNTENEPGVRARGAEFV